MLSRMYTYIHIRELVLALVSHLLIYIRTHRVTLGKYLDYY